MRYFLRLSFPTLRAQCIAAVWLIAFAATVRPALAQDIKEPDPAKARLRLGPVALNPTIQLTNLGIDTNVYNEPDAIAKDDFTFTLTPKADAWMKMGPTWLTGTIRSDVIWFQTYENERAANMFYTVGWTVPLNRLAFAVEGGYLHARERAGFEIDIRARRSELSGKAAVEYRALAKTYLGVRGSQQRVDYDEHQLYLGTDLQTELNRTVTRTALTVRHQLTPLTAIIVDAGTQNDRFEFTPSRDTDSTTAGVQISFDPFALIKGSARFGYRDFVPVDPAVPKYQGSTIAVDLSYVLQGSTKLAFQATRDIQYSYDLNQPYYLDSGLSGSIAQQIYGPIDVVVRGGRNHLDYRDRSGATVAFPERTDQVTTFGAGAGYHLGADMRIGFTVDKQKRTSVEPLRNYQGIRAGVSVTYGL